jgi:DNA-binding LytR/AlgR family response regulator
MTLAAETRPDIAFLDIRMPVHSGLEVAREIGAGCHVVFITAYDEYAVAAFDEGAVDYVLKPPAPERVAKVVARLKARLAAAPLDLAALLEKLAPREGGAGPLRWIRASLGASMKMIAVDDIVYFQAGDKYTRVITGEGEALIRKPIKDLYDELDPEAFWQIHRGTIVNLRSIARVDRDWRGEPVIVLRERDEKLPVSRTFAHRFKSM